MYKEIFHTRLKGAREEAEFTQREIAEITGLTQDKISKYEHGKLEPDIENLGKLADALNVTTDWLIGRGKKQQ